MNEFYIPREEPLEIDQNTPHKDVLALRIGAIAFILFSFMVMHYQHLQHLSELH